MAVFMIKNIINNFNNYSFLSRPVKVVQSLAWVALAILALPTVVGSYLALKKAVAVWSKNERSDTEIVHAFAEKVLIKKTTEDLLHEWTEKSPQGEDRLVAKQRILDFFTNQSDYLDLSGLHLSSLPNCFDDERFQKLKRIDVFNNQFLVNLPPTIKNLDVHIVFEHSGWRAMLDPEQIEELVQNSDSPVGEDSGIDDDFGFIDQEPLSQSALHQSQIKNKKELYKAAIAEFRTSNYLGTRSAEAYFDYLKSTGHGFYFNMDLLHSVVPDFDVFLTRVKAEIEQAKQENVSLVFVPFLLAGNAFREQHIVVGVINTAQQQIECFDPKGNQFYSVFGSLSDRNLPHWNMPSQDFLKNLAVAIFPDKKDPSVIRNINGPQSLMNRMNCGAHALDFIQTRLYTDLIQSNDPNYFETSLRSNGAQLREEMAATLEARLATIE